MKKFPRILVRRSCLPRENLVLHVKAKTNLSGQGRTAMEPVASRQKKLAPCPRRPPVEVVPARSLLAAATSGAISLAEKADCFSLDVRGRADKYKKQTVYKRAR